MFRLPGWVQLVLAETSVVAVIAFAFFLWPFPPLVWKPSQAALNAINPGTLLMATMAWVGVGYLLGSWAWWLSRPFRGQPSVTALTPSEVAPEGDAPDYLAEREAKA